MGAGEQLSWCRSCGRDADGSRSTCASCGWDLVGPDGSGARHVGNVVKIGRALLSRPGICLVEEDGKVEVVSKGAERSWVAVDAFDSLPGLEIALPEVESDAGRIMRAHIASAKGLLKAKWEEGLIRETAVALATRTVATRRAALRDWLLIGADEELLALELTPTEVCWARAHLAARNREADAALTQLESLPADGYRAKVGVIVSLVPQIAAGADLRRRALQLLAPFEESDREARAVIAMLDVGRDMDRLAIADELAALCQEERPEEASMLRTAVRVVREHKPAEDLDGEALPVTAALEAYHRGMAGAVLDAEPNRLGVLGTSLLDDLVDVGALTKACSSALPIDGDDLTYLLARIDPDRLTIDQLESIGSRAEVARRMFLSRDAAALLQRGVDDPDAAHYAALLRTMTNEGCGREGLRPEAASVLDAIDVYLAVLSERQGAQPPAALLDDPSCWRLLQSEARRGRIVLTEAQRRDHPAFAMWLDLYEMQACVFAHDWTGVRDLGQRLMGKVTDELLSDEILNMAAYAQFQLGNDKLAVDMLTEAVRGRHTEALLVNASIVARERSAEDAAIFLSQLYNEAGDPTVGIAALLRSIELWRSDSRAAPALPETIRDIVRTALTRPLADHELDSLLSVAQSHDGEWLASAPLISTGSLSQRWRAQFHITFARVLLAEYQETMRDLAVSLVEARKQLGSEKWIESQLDRMVNSLLDSIHVPFGDAVHLVPVVTVLLEAGALDVPQRLILSAQAGAHLAVSSRDDGSRRLPPDGEKRFLVQPVDLFLSQRTSMEDGVREMVGEELQKCLAVATSASADVTRAALNEFASEWDALVARERFDVQNRMSILEREKTILNSVTNEVRRTQVLVQHLARLPLDSDGRNFLGGLQNEISQWERDLARLRSFL